VTEISLPEQLLRTLKSVQSGLETSEQIYRHDKDRRVIGRGAINKRLEKLRALGFITRERIGVFIKYKPSNLRGTRNLSVKRK
jgi:hypothetical protein